jgi:hypothetical protein
VLLYAHIPIVGGGVVEQTVESSQPEKKSFWKWIYRFRSLLLAIPVVIASVILAIYNTIKLPAVVGINMQSNGEYAMAVAKAVAVLGPFALTTVCLLLMFCSKKVLYPWLISVFSLVLPLILLFSNTFP